jgi:hypothetical protein
MALHPSLRPWDVARKAFVGGCVIIASGVQADLFPHPWDDVAIAVLAVAGYFGIYATRNLALPGASGSTDGTPPGSM